MEKESVSVRAETIWRLYTVFNSNSLEKSFLSVHSQEGGLAYQPMESSSLRRLGYLYLQLGVYPPPFAFLLRYGAIIALGGANFEGSRPSVSYRVASSGCPWIHVGLGAIPFPTTFD